MGSYTLVEYSANWADEIDLYGYFILNDSALKEFKKVLTGIKKFNFHFGTNEIVNYEDISHLESDLVYKEISELEYLAFERLNLLNVGINPYYSLMNYVEEEEEDCEPEDNSYLCQAYFKPENQSERKITMPTDEEIEILIARLKKNHS